MKPVAAPVERPAVPRCWPGETVVCIGSGPSLTPDDVALCQTKAVRVIAIKDNIKLAPWADVLYACDAKWWHHYGPTLTYAGPKYSLEPQRYATVLRETGPTGLETDPTGLRTGRNSGYQSINLAYHFGAARILLLGFDGQPDGQRDRWHGEHPWKLRPCYEWEPLFATLVEPLSKAGVDVLNCSRVTRYTCFPQMPLADALAREAPRV